MSPLRALSKLRLEASQLLLRGRVYKTLPLKVNIIKTKEIRPDL